MNNPAVSWSRPSGPVERVAEGMIRLGLRIAQLGIGAMMVLITADVVARNIFRVSLLISDEVSGYLLVVMTFFGIAYSLRSGSLLRIDFLLDSLPRPVRLAVDVMFDVLALAVSAVLLYALSRFTLSTWERQMVSPTLIETPLWIPQLAMPIGCAILVTGFLLELRGSVRRLLGHAPQAHDRARPAPEAMS